MASREGLTETIRVRVEASTKDELASRAAKIGRSSSDLARRYIRDGLARDELGGVNARQLRTIINREREAGRAFGELAEACRAELTKRGLPA